MFRQLIPRRLCAALLPSSGSRTIRRLPTSEPYVARAIRAQFSTISDMTSSPKKAEAQYPGFITLKHRFVAMAEVTVSKIFPAGFGWQLGSIFAADAGFQTTSLSFAIATGAGDFCGVLLGHTAFYAIKKAINNDDESIESIASTGLFLASAAFCSGSVWQPVVNLLQSGNLSYLSVTAGTTLVCAGAFFTGLRAGRIFYPRLGVLVAPPSYKNLKNDSALSFAIGGAGGGFVGTDVTYLPEENLLKAVVGIEAQDANLVACIKAGSATSLGFAALQGAQNFVYPEGKNWTD